MMSLYNSIKVKVTKPDQIKVYKDPDGKYRWTRRNGGNHKIVGASTESYSRLRAALSNVKRTQRPPFELEIEEDK
jgi:uncharacterized protein YegP (UPF0339 family)